MQEVTMIPSPRVSGTLRQTPLAATQRRWQIFYQQMQEGHEPCFQSDRRHSCPDTACPYRGECIGAGLRAEWRR